VNCGRLRRSRSSAPLAKLVTPNRCTKIVLGPIAPIMSRSDWSKPRIIAVMPTIAVMPITTPSTVSAERSLLLRIVSSAMRTTSPNRVARIVDQSCRPEKHKGHKGYKGHDEYEESEE